MSTTSVARRKDRVGEHRTAYDKNRKRVLMSQQICGICGRPVDKTLPVGNPFAPEVDHIIPISVGGHPSDISNLQLVHSICNKQKSNKLQRPLGTESEKTQNERWTLDWLSYRAK